MQTQRAQVEAAWNLILQHFVAVVVGGGEEQEEETHDDGRHVGVQSHPHLHITSLGKHFPLSPPQFQLQCKEEVRVSILLAQLPS